MNLWICGKTPSDLAELEQICKDLYLEKKFWKIFLAAKGGYTTYWLREAKYKSMPDISDFVL